MSVLWVLPISLILDVIFYAALRVRFKLKMRRTRAWRRIRQGIQIARGNNRWIIDGWRAQGWHDQSRPVVAAFDRTNAEPSNTGSKP